MGGAGLLVVLTYLDAWLGIGPGVGFDKVVSVDTWFDCVVDDLELLGAAPGRHRPWCWFL